MQALYECCCGLDVHAKRVVGCLLKSGSKQVRTFGALTDDLLSLADWLAQSGCTHVAMESRGVYWKPVFNILEGLFEVILVNARHIKAVPGRKTDGKDCEWLADLLRHGLLRGSFIPPQEIRAPARVDALPSEPGQRSSDAGQPNPEAGRKRQHQVGASGQ